VSNTTFNNISVISLRSVLLVKETGYPEKTTDLSQVTDKPCFFKCLNTDFVGSTNTILDICLILLTIYIFIPVSGCVGRGPSALLCPGARKPLTCRK
jgi:hypothetical protein